MVVHLNAPDRDTLDSANALDQAIANPNGRLGSTLFVHEHLAREPEDIINGAEGEHMADGRFESLSAHHSSPVSALVAEADDQLVDVERQTLIGQRDLATARGVGRAIGVEQAGQQFSALKLRSSQISRRDVLVAEHADLPQHSLNGAVVVMACLAAHTTGVGYAAVGAGRRRHRSRDETYFPTAGLTTGPDFH